MELKEYEFISKSQNELIGTLSQEMRFVGIFLIVASGLSIVGGLWMLLLHILRQDHSNIYEVVWSPIVWGILNFFIGMWTFKAAASFKLIVDEQGNDMKNLMVGLEEVRNAYGLQQWIFIIILAGVGLLVLALILLLILAVLLAVLPS